MRHRDRRVLRIVLSLASCVRLRGPSVSALSFSAAFAHGAEKSEAELVVAGDKLEAKGVKLALGAKVVAALVTPSAKAITVRSTVK